MLSGVKRCTTLQLQHNTISKRHQTIQGPAVMVSAPCCLTAQLQQSQAFAVAQAVFVVDHTVSHNSSSQDHYPSWIIWGIRAGGLLKLTTWNLWVEEAGGTQDSYRIIRLDASVRRPSYVYTSTGCTLGSIRTNEFH